ncbi:MAG: hypothetical protein HGA23_01115 [Bacteroidales bacterium]|nr:hypothetical protein [Bacteroidales bacterium]
MQNHRLLDGGMLNQIILYVTAMMEMKSSMGVIVAAPTAGSHTASPAQIVWRWNVVSGATGYKWSTTNNYATATDMGTNLSRTETGLNCNTAYQRYVWAYSNCGNSTAATLSHTTTIETPAAPAAGTHVASNTQVIWNWNAVAGVTGYKWNTINDYATAINMATATTYTENNLLCGTNYTRYVWAYNNCANSVSAQLIKTTAVNPPPNPVAATHTVSGNQIIWNWNIVTGATGYKWSATNDYATATDVGNVTSRTENGLSCSTGYTRYVWAYNGCANSSSVSLSATTTATPPASPASGDHTAYSSQIVWTWSPVGDAVGYKWNTVNIYSSAVNVGASTSYAESGLSCSTTYTRFAWAYNSCGVSTPVILTGTTSDILPDAPTQGTHVANVIQIIWNWNTVAGVSGYKWSTTNNYATAIDMGTSTSYTENGLTCGNNYTRYVWSYHTCGTSTATTLVMSTEACFVCGTTINKSHVAGSVAPVNKTTSYATVTGIPGATSLCWITSNLGSDHQATSVSDNTEASAGWYWQFNRAQGYKHDGTARTPNTTWITPINENIDWTAANDPCSIELGIGWRMPTSAEWSAVDVAGNWTTWTGPWNSNLKIHAAGKLSSSTGALSLRGTQGMYWSTTQNLSYNNGQALFLFSSSCDVSMQTKAYGATIRCLKD